MRFLHFSVFTLHVFLNLFHFFVSASQIRDLWLDAL